MTLPAQWRTKEAEQTKKNGINSLIIMFLRTGEGMLTDTRERSEVKRFGAAALVHIDSLYRLALYMTGDEVDAQELVQSTYRRAYRSFYESEMKAIAKTWLFGIMNDMSMDAIPRNRRRLRTLHPRETEEQEIESLSDTHSEENILEVPFDHDFMAIMNKLPARYGIVVLLADVEELSYREIADIIGCSEKAVMYRLCKGRRLFRKRLQGQNLWEINMAAG